LRAEEEPKAGTEVNTDLTSIGSVVANAKASHEQHNPKLLEEGTKAAIKKY